MTTFSIRCSEELKERLIKLLENEITGNEKAEKLVKSLVNGVDADRYKQEQSRLQGVNENLQLVNTNLQKEIEKYDLQTTELQALIAKKEAQISEIQAVADGLQIRLQETEERLQKTEEHLQTANGDNVLTFEVPEPANSLLGEYARRLQIEPQAILIDMFVRYVTEQYNHWFFDFAVKKSEFKEVCGYSHAEVTNWLNAQK